LVTPSSKRMLAMEKSMRFPIQKTQGAQGDALKACTPVQAS